MHPSVIIRRLWLYASVVCLLVLSLLASGYALFLSQGYHALIHAPLGIVSSLQPQDSLAVLGSLQRYLADPTPGLIQSPLFTNPEREHLLELKTLFQAGQRLLVLTALLIVLLGLAGWWGGLARQTWAGVLRVFSYAQLGLVGLAVLVMASGFKDRFDGLHGLLFSQANWVFPKASVSIQLFPLRYFIVTGWVWAMALLLLALSSFLLARYLEGRSVMGHRATEHTEKMN